MLDAAMSRETATDENFVQFNIRVPKSLVTRLDAMVVRRRERAPALMVSRSDVVREVLYEAVDRDEVAAKRRK